MNAREISTLVRDALLLKEQQESGQPETLIGELEAEATSSLRGFQNLIDSMARQRRLWIANGMKEAIADPAIQIGGTFNRSRWAEIEEAFNTLEVWLATPLPGCKLPPVVVVSRRGNPYEAPPVVDPPTEPPTEPPAE
jgi:hypothetical protein